MLDEAILSEVVTVASEGRNGWMRVVDRSNPWITFSKSSSVGEDSLSC